MHLHKPYIGVNRLVTYSIGLYAINLIGSFVPENYAQVSAIVCNIRRLTPEQADENVFGCRSEAESKEIVSSFLMEQALDAEARIPPSGRCDVLMDLMLPSPDGFGS